MIVRVHGARSPLLGAVDAPASKNYTTRHILVSCLARGRSVVHAPAVQDDSIALVLALRRFGARIDALDKNGAAVEFSLANAARIDRLDIEGFGHAPKLQGTWPVDCGNAGAVLRFLLAIGALLPEVEFTTSHPTSLGRRPNIDLLDALKQLGVEVEANGPDGLLPIRLRGGKARLASSQSRTVRVSGAKSSQFVSALIFLAPLLGGAVRIEIAPPVRSRPLIDTTLAVLNHAGIEVRSTGEGLVLDFAAYQVYQPREWRPNGDWPGAAAILAAAAVVPGSRVQVGGLHKDEQGESRCLEYFQKAGLVIGWEHTSGAPAPPQLSAAPVTISHPSSFIPHPFGFDGDLATDAVPALLGAAMLFNGTVRFNRIGTLQYKESDRVRVPVAELRRIHATALPAPDGSRPWLADQCITFAPADSPETISITGWPHGFAGGIPVDGHHDHRIIMMLSIVALRCRDGLDILGAEHVSKSFPGWFDTLRKLGATVEVLE